MKFVMWMSSGHPLRCRSPLRELFVRIDVGGTILQPYIADTEGYIVCSWGCWVLPEDEWFTKSAENCIFKQPSDSCEQALLRTAGRAVYWSGSCHCDTNGQLAGRLLLWVTVHIHVVDRYGSCWSCVSFYKSRATAKHLKSRTGQFC